MPTVHVVNDFTDTIKVDLDKIVSLYWNKKPFEHEQVYDMDDIDDAWLDDYMVQMPHEIEQVGEGEAYPRVKIEKVGSKRTVVFTLKTEMAFTEESLEDLKFRELKQGGKALSVALHRTVEKLGAQNIIDGFTSKQGIDAVSIFNTSHTLSKAAGLGNPITTYSNRSTSQLNIENLKTRYTHMMQQRDENGDLLNVLPRKLVVGPNKWLDAQQILSNPDETGTANRNKNVIKGLLDPCLLSFFAESTTYANAWMLLDPEIAMHRGGWRVKPVSKMGRESTTDNHLYRIRCRLAFGWTHWHGWDANEGTA